MQISDYLVSYIGSTIPLIFYILCYNRLCENKKKLKLSIFIFVPFISVLGLLNTHFNYSYTKLLISFMIIFVNNQIAFKEKFNQTFVKSLLIYLIYGGIEIIISIPIILNYNNLVAFDNGVIVKILFTLLLLFVLLFVFYCKTINIILKRIIRMASNERMAVFYIIISTLLIVFLGCKFLFYIDTKTYLLNLLILTCYAILLFFSIYNQVKIKRAEEQQEILLNFMTKYEKIIENNRNNKHEILNNLLILKSYKNKNSKEFENTLNDLISEYDKSGNIIKDIHNLPSGIKGILYYKLHDMELSKIKVFIKIMKNVNSFFKSLPEKEYKYTCNVMSILLDNAKEAAETSKDKSVLIDFEVNEDKLIMTIQNTFDEKVDLSKINNRNFSTKGKNRGIGLHIAQSIINKSSSISLEQSILDKYFVSTLTITE